MDNEILMSVLQKIFPAVDLKNMSAEDFVNFAEKFDDEKNPSTKNFSAAIADYTRAIELLPNEKSTKILLPWAYYMRAQCYKALGDNAKAQADMKKYNELKGK